ncbi:GntR family transcriptional regulator [Companilactobacillus nuruki]|uniref:GntR family transcriptional regulator n=1 Tax=Companilactobacillus nuruki TaxID=1993540 RepID=A0A2N7AS63_9LACO|nr:GntR family transcriptional regulator [Companilactobacillus nuruki]PMD68182.1 GntR family transcriptional regulator [Companilactobacillus nuruki]
MAEKVINKDIYKTLRNRIITGKYDKKMRLPTEDLLIKEFDASRYAIRKSIKELSDEGLVYSVKGKGVVILERTPDPSNIKLSLDKVNTLQMSDHAEEISRITSIADFKMVITDDKLSKLTSFKKGLPLYVIKRIRHVNKRNVVLDINYLNAQLVPKLTAEIAKRSIYSYVQNDLNMKISIVKRYLNLEHAQEIDYKYLNLGFSNCIGNMVTFTFNDNGKLFEYSESHFIPDLFAFNQIIKF